nr:HAD-IA family hydrolase [Cochlodiniinecator piscidefendens]
MVVFDVDGTLVDSQTHIMEATRVAFIATGIDVPRQSDVLACVGLSLPKMMERLAPQLNAQTHLALENGYKQAFVAMREAGDAKAQSPLFDNAREIINQLSVIPDVLLGVATGKSRRGLDHMLAENGFGDVFITQQVSDHHPSKPHPSMLLSALSETGVDPENAIMVGDTSFDIEMGIKAGFQTVGVSWGYHTRDQLKHAGANQILDHFDELPTMLNTLWGGPYV